MFGAARIKAQAEFDRTTLAVLVDLFEETCRELDEGGEVNTTAVLGIGAGLTATLFDPGSGDYAKSVDKARGWLDTHAELADQMKKEVARMVKRGA